MKKFLIALTASAALICGAACLTACSNGTEYSVVCQTSENGYVTVAADKVAAGDKVILAAHPSAGYMLTAFTVDGKDIDGVSFVMPAKDVTVSARFELVTYSITYVFGDTTVSGNNPDTYTVESADALIEPEKDGYEICGWYRYCVEPEYYYGWDMEYYRVKTLEGLYGNLTLYAKYYNAVHTIEVSDCDHGSCYIEEYYGEATFGDTFEITVQPYDGYELDHIAVNGEHIDGTTFTMPACDVEITAQFKAIKYAITYELDGGTNDPDNPLFYTIDDGSITFADAYKEGYIFVGWDYDYGDDSPQYLWNSTFDIYTPCYPITLYARFIPEDEEYEY